MNYRIVHMLVGPYENGRVVSASMIPKDEISRLLSLGAIEPVDEPATEEPVPIGPENSGIPPEASLPPAPAPAPAPKTAPGNPAKMSSTASFPEKTAAEEDSEDENEGLRPAAGGHAAVASPQGQRGGRSVAK